MIDLNIDGIADEAKVPVSNVMQVLYNQPETLDPIAVSRIMSAVRKQGLEDQFYAMTSRTNVIGVFVPGGDDLDFAYYVAQAVATAAQRRGYSVAYHVQRSASPLYPHDFLDLIGNKGAVIVASDDAQIMVETCRIHDCPYVLVESEYRESHSAGVEIVTSNRQSTEDAVRYLVGLGHRRFAYMTGNLDNRSMRDRLDGYQLTLHAAGISYDPDQLIETDWTADDAYNKCQALFAGSRRPTAVLCANDLVAMGVMRAAQERGLVIGDHLSIVGFDDVDAARSARPTLTTLRQPMAQMGECAFTELQQMMDGREPSTRHLTLPAELVIRQSTGPAPA